MNVQISASPSGISSGTATYNFTFGPDPKATIWSAVRPLTWAELAAVLTRHEVGAKAGPCIVPAVFSGMRRHKNDATCIEVAFLDSDSGATLTEITGALGQRGWAAIVSSTFSHMATTTRVRHGNWEKFVRGNGTADAAEFLVREKGYLPRIAAGARLLHQDDEFTVFEHQPCPKFRVAVPLLRPWVAAAYEGQQQANAAWKERIKALAVALGLSHDQACTDTSRLFFLPRRPADGPAPETAVLEGSPCDIFALPAAKGTRDAGSHSARRLERSRTAESAVYIDPASGETVDLVAWARHFGQGFEIAEALRARRPDLFVGKVADQTKHHIRCANEDEHTEAGADAATIVINASESTNGGFVYHCRHGHCDGRDRLLFLRKMLERDWLTVADLTDARFQAGGRAPQPVIQFVPGDLHNVVDRAEQALIDADLGLYQRGPLIVRPGCVRVTVAEQRDVTAQRILEVEDHAIAEAMTKAAAWERLDARSGKWVPIDAPLRVATTYKQRAGRWRLPVLAGLINAPTLRPDGSILGTPGYDRSTGLLLDMQDVRFPTIAGRPSRDDALAALRMLEELVSTFPFVGERSRAVALSAILTACIRRSLPTAPMHAFTAPTAGSGKSMLVDLSSVIATGREAGVISQGKTEEELEKRLSAQLLAGDQVIAIDNCEAPLGGEFLCSMLTQRAVRARILGRSEAPELPASACVTATGNNLVLVGDMTRRTVLCQLDPRHERPELRRFASNPVQMAKAERGRLLAAALTVLRAYHVAGRPGQPTPLGSFEAWSGWVRGALLWLGHADPVETMEEARELDPQLDALTAVVTQWRAVIGAGAVSARELIDGATQQRTALDARSITPPKLEFVHPDFREALLAVAGEGGVINSRRFGKWLGAHRDRLVSGVRIVRHGLICGVMHWRLEQIDGATLTGVAE